MESGVFHTTYESDTKLRRTPAQKIRLVLLLAFLLIFPFVAGRYYLTLANLVGIAVIGALGLNILTGFTGQISLGQGGFMAVGAYATGVLTAQVGLPFWLTIPIACTLTAIVGAIFGIPSLRLKGLYLAIATLAAQIIILWVVTHWKALTGGVDSLVVPNTEIFGFNFNSGNSDFRWYWPILGFATLSVLFTVNLFRSRVGRAFVAIRDQDIAAEVMGVNLFVYKLLAFAVSSFLVGLAGALTAHYRLIVTWERFTLETSILYLAMIIVGGLGSVSGSVLGAALLTLLPAFISNVGMALSGVAPALAHMMPYVQQGVFGAVIILFLIVEPEGLAKIWKDIKDYFRLWPFPY